MAVFQYSLELLPFGDVDKFERILRERKTERAQTEVWKPQPTTASLTRLRQLLPINQSWGSCEEYVSSLEVWNSDLRIWHRDVEHDYVEAIVIRISAVGFSPSLMHNIVDIAKHYAWYIGASESKRICEPDFDMVLADFKNSRAARFLVDPSAVIIEAAREIDENPEHEG